MFTDSIYNARQYTLSSALTIFTSPTSFQQIDDDAKRLLRFWAFMEGKDIQVSFIPH